MAKSADGTSSIVLSNWAFQRVGRVMILCSSGRNPPPAADFEVWIARMIERDFDRLLIYSDGGSPGVTQRARIAEAWKSTGREPHVALMTDSSLARGLLTAIGWLIGGKMKPFPLADLDASLSWLDATDSATEIAQTIAQLRAALRTRNARSA